MARQEIVCNIKTAQTGAILPLVLILLALFSVMVAITASGLKQELRMGHTFIRRQQALDAAMAGLQLAISRCVTGGGNSDQCAPADGSPATLTDWFDHSRSAYQMTAVRTGSDIHVAAVGCTDMTAAPAAGSNPCAVITAGQGRWVQRATLHVLPGGGSLTTSDGTTLNVQYLP